jgi:hypothetical protein
MRDPFRSVICDSLEGLYGANNGWGISQINSQSLRAQISIVVLMGTHCKVAFP